jgi:hypothetical protein
VVEADEPSVTFDGGGTERRLFGLFSIIGRSSTAITSIAAGERIRRAEEYG